MSLRLKLFVAMMRGVAKPLLRNTGTPESAARDFAILARVAFPSPRKLRHRTTAGPVPLHWISAGHVPAAPGKVILYFHGGAYLSGSGRTHRSMLARLSLLSGIEVCAPDYRLLQTAPFPAACDDAFCA